MSFRPSRVALVASIFACALVVPTTADAAGAVLPLSERPNPAFVDVRMAVAVTPTGSTRWTELTVPVATPAMWLVPVRPGAAIDWAPARWLDALDEATAPQVLPPSFSSSCPSRSTPETPASWTTPRSKQPAPALAVQATADDARAYAAERGYRQPGVSSKITALYASGWNLVALEMSSSSTELSSGTLRVSDDGGAVLPLTLSGGSSTRLTVFAIGAGVAAVPGTQDVARQALRWGPEGSPFAAWRNDLIKAGGGATWLRESASHDAIFDSTTVTGGSPIPSVVTGYFKGTSCSPAAARSVSSSDGVVGTSCAPGAAARVRGDGAACVPTSGAVDPSELSCTADIDLALAFSGLAPSNAVVTRLVGWVPAGALGTNIGVEIHPAAKRSPPAIRAGAYEACAPSPSNDSPLAPPSSPRQPAPGSGTAGAGGEEVYVPTSDGCGGGTIATGDTYQEEAEPAPADDSSSTESCSGGGSTSGWDDGDESDGWDDSDSGDSCSSDDSSSSSDSCSGGSSSSSSGGSDDGWDTGDDSDDGWDTEDDMSPKRKKLEPSSKKPHAKATKKKASPVSRYALLAVALILPLRRRRRDPEAG